MPDRRFVILSGISGRAGELLRQQLKGNQIGTITRSRAGAESFEEYHARLLAAATEFLAPIAATPGIRTFVLLVSSFSAADAVHSERTNFFPAVRRLQVAHELAANPLKTSEIVGKIRETFNRWSQGGLCGEVKPTVNSAALLPAHNIKSRKWVSSIEKIYNLEAEELDAGVYRDVQRLKGGRGFVSNNLTFIGVINSAEHPVRRRTETSRCDFHAMLRLGMGVPERFEFDVNCAKGSKGRSLCHCDGSREKVPAGATHVNMRINDDFECR